MIASSLVVLMLAQVPVPALSVAAPPVAASNRKAVSLKDALGLAAKNNQDLAAQRAVQAQYQAQASVSKACASSSRLQPVFTCERWWLRAYQV